MNSEKDILYSEIKRKLVANLCWIILIGVAVCAGVLMMMNGGVVPFLWVPLVIEIILCKKSHTLYSAVKQDSSVIATVGKIERTYDPGDSDHPPVYESSVFVNYTYQGKEYKNVRWYAMNSAFRMNACFPSKREKVVLLIHPAKHKKILFPKRMKIKNCGSFYDVVNPDHSEGFREKGKDSYNYEKEYGPLVYWALMMIAVCLMLSTLFDFWEKSVYGRPYSMMEFVSIEFCGIGLFLLGLLLKLKVKIKGLMWGIFFLLLLALLFTINNMFFKLVDVILIIVSVVMFIYRNIVYHMKKTQ